jgi:hypothetical protein
MKSQYWILKLCIGFSLLSGCTAIMTHECHHANQSSSNTRSEKKGLPLNDKRKISAVIVGSGHLRAETMKKVLKMHNPKLSDAKSNAIIQAYIKECRTENINHDIAFTQMCLETNYLKYGGQVHATQNNFAGLGATDNGARGAKFRTLCDGVRAHVQHLKAYASKEMLKNPCIDPRFRFVKRGSARTIYDLAGKWASDRHYGEKIRDRMILFYKLQDS